MAFNTTTSENLAILVSKDKDPVKEGFTLTRMWTFLDATVADTLSTTLDSHPLVKNPQADGQTYTGDFASAKVVLEGGIDDNNQRYRKIIQTLILLALPANSTALLALDSRLKSNNEILSIAELNLGERDGYSYIFDNLAPVTVTVLMEIITDNELLIGLPLGGAAQTAWAGSTSYTVGLIRQFTDGRLYICGIAHTSGTFATDLRDGKWQRYWQYVTREFEVLDNNTARFTVSFSKLSWKGTGNEEIQFSAANGNQSEQERILYPNLDSAQAQIVLDDAKTNTADMTGATPASPGGHVLKTIARISAGGGKYNVTRVTWEPIISISYDSWNNFTAEYEVTTPKFRRISGSDQIRFFVFTTYIKQTTSASAAHSYVDNDSGTNSYIKSNVEYCGYNRFRAIGVTASCTPWETDTKTWNDLGGKA